MRRRTGSPRLSRRNVVPASEDVTTDPRQRLRSLAKAVERLLERLEAAEARASAAEKRRVEVEDLLRKMTDGKADPAAMSARLEKLESENVDLVERVDRGLEGIDRLLARVRFMEDQR
jgi:septation ring formation regulator EzrA